MNELFGAPTSTIAAVMLCLLGVALLSVAFLAVRNRTMFRLGLRNLPRRGSQTVLVVFGLMLATLITTAAFVTGDTVDHSLTKGSYDLFQRSDLDITWNGERNFDQDAGAENSGQQSYVAGNVVGRLESQFAGDPDIAAFLPALYEQGSATDRTSGRSVPVVQLAGYDPARIGSVGGLRLADGGPAPLDLAEDQVLVTERAAKELHASTGDAVTITINGVTSEFRVAGIVRDELSAGELGLPYAHVPGGVAMPIARLQALMGFSHGEMSALTVALTGGVRDTLDRADGARDRIAAYVEGEGAALFGPESGLEPGRSAEVFTAKADSVENGELSGNIFTTLFLLLGLFSMAAGIMLIFMIFVMLAAERRPEMGMARAVGAQRGHLVKSFLFEGMAYSLLAGVAGVILGVACSWLLTDVLLKQVGGEYFSLVEMQITPTALVIGYSLGVLITFVTVVFASLKATHVNIVAAIRGLDDEGGREPRRRTRWPWVAAGVPTLIVPPVGIWFMFRKGFGLPWRLILAPLGIVFGLYLMQVGKANEVLFFFSLGISLVPISIAAIARHFGAPNRATWTAVGAFLLVYWLLPANAHEALFGTFDSDIEMFVLSGVMIVVGATLMIVFNAGFLTGLFTSTQGTNTAYALPALLAVVAAGFAVAGVLAGGEADGLGEISYLIAGITAFGAVLSGAAARFPQMAPALTMAVAYPLANRFRTGMTIAMFSLIVFSLTVWSILLSNFSELENGSEARGGIDVLATASRTSTVGDVQAALAAAGSSVIGQVAGSGRTTLPEGGQQARIPGEAFEDYPVLAADDAFFASLHPVIEARARGYETDEQVLQALRTQPNLALIDRNGLGAADNDSNYDWSADADVTANRFDPFQVEVRDADTGITRTVTVIGSLRNSLYPSWNAGIYVTEETYTQVFGDPSYQRTYFRLVDGADARRVAEGIEAVLAQGGVEADSVQKLLDDQGSQNMAFTRMFQGFMALGLFVGIAGLGVIAFRSVVERRQQIGMLRAIGFQRGTVSFAFLLESSFIAAMGILAGVAGGAILARNLMTSDQFTEGTSAPFAIPWADVLVVIIASFAFSLLMTWWPSRGAARVPVAEALRYE